MSINRRQQSMSVAKLMRLFHPVEQLATPGHDWPTELQWLRDNHPRRIARIRRSIERRGILDPIRLCYADPTCGPTHHVVDGHHRIAIALDLDIKRVPIADAWDGSDWLLHTPDEQNEDPLEWTQ